jgi:4-hydroxybutyrate CoA-transferase
VNEGRADYTPVFFSQLPKLFQEKTLPLDVALICVSPPDTEGWMSYGVSVDYTQAAARHAQLVIAEVNELMPRTYGARIHVSEVDYVLRSERALPELHPTPIGPVEHQIGLHIASLIADGDCLQLGIGSIPDAVLSCLYDKGDLGIHTEMFSDGVVDLYRAGVITNRRKTLDEGKLVATFLMGTKKLYDFVHKNPAVLMQPVDYTNNVLVAGHIDHLMSINSALQVDINGQVCADMIGPQQFSGVGGQVDFVRAAAASRGGRSIIALPSTAKNGTISRIVARLDPGACVTTSRYDVDTIVTEFGVAELRGKTLRQRARALQSIAHPDFRDQLWDQVQSSPARAMYV